MGNKQLTKARLDYIDVLRVIAMITVFVCHYTRSLESAGVGYTNKILPDFIFNVYLGSFGVAVFFVLSGASLMYTNSERSIGEYAKKRFLGIFPTFWIAYLVAFLYYFWIRKGFYPMVSKKFMILTVIGMDGYTGWIHPNFYILGEWFLGCLILLYLLFPLLKFGVKEHPYITALVIAVIYAVGPFLYDFPIPMDVFFLFRIPEFAIGMYFIHYKWDIKWYVALVCAVILTVFAFADLSALGNLYKYTIVGVSVCAVFVWVCRFVHVRILFDICKTIGKYSYAVFLTHHVIIQEIANHFSGKFLTRAENYILFLMCALLTALVSVALNSFSNWVVRSVRGLNAK